MSNETMLEQQEFLKLDSELKAFGKKLNWSQAALVYHEYRKTMGITDAFNKLRWDYAPCSGLDINAQSADAQLRDVKRMAEDWETFSSSSEWYKMRQGDNYVRFTDVVPVKEIKQQTGSDGKPRIDPATNQPEMREQVIFTIEPYDEEKKVFLPKIKWSTSSKKVVGVISRLKAANGGVLANLVLRFTRQGEEKNTVYTVVKSGVPA